ncbi:O-antigen ligase family protein [Psychroflexus montanilacus]|uniref:O-antigen ligase family protein n=1 Tax=Psychroflexus montanilacus TaxID=2873598 RepID=UPI001CCE7674|nr:O-antigen ligase family protein [Psychroflexus montanilacus]MBZ9652086.1 O-antigen ligase family protein [Psychroflexus montanilacus]
MFGLDKPSFQHLKGLAFHVGVGVVVSQIRAFAQLYLLGIVVYFIYQIVTKKEKTYYALGAAAYIAAAEIFLRMTKAMPFWELGKYLVIFFMLLGMLYEGFKLKAWPVLVFLLLLLPGVIVSYLNFDYFDQSFRKTILFNLSGPLSLFATALFCYQKQIKFGVLLKIIDLMILPILGMVVYIILYAPPMEQIVFTTESNAATSGGYSGNQVATILGLGMFFTYIRFLIPYKNLLLNLINIGFLGLLTYRCLLTFSRGGLITAILMMLIFTLLFINWASLIRKAKATVKLISLGIGGFLLWGIAMTVTKGLILNRYTGKNALGEEQDITSGRGDILSQELEAFLEDPFLGVGVGMGKFFRIEEEGSNLASHNEVTRMLAEHGILGIVALLVLLLIPLAFFLSKNRNLLMLPFVAFWFLTINHSAMRVALPGFIYGFALLTITYASKPKKKNKTKTASVPRQQAVA